MKYTAPICYFYACPRLFPDYSQIIFDDITYFQYQKKHNREHGPAVVGIELKQAADYDPLLQRMKTAGFFNDYLNNQPELFSMLL